MTTELKAAAAELQGTPETFKDVVIPLMKWLADNHHPHTQIVLTASDAVLFEGVKSFSTDDFIKD